MSGNSEEEVQEDCAAATGRNADEAGRAAPTVEVLEPLLKEVSGGPAEGLTEEWGVGQLPHVVRQSRAGLMHCCELATGKIQPRGKAASANGCGQSIWGSGPSCRIETTKEEALRGATTGEHE